MLGDGTLVRRYAIIYGLRGGSYCAVDCGAALQPTTEPSENSTMHNPTGSPHATARIRFLRKDEGGCRRTAIYSGYRPTVRSGGQNNDATISFSEREFILPGEEAEIELRFLVPDLVLHRLAPGMAFTLREGARVVATGRILDVLN